MISLFKEKVIEFAIRSSAIVVISSLILIFIFIGKEAIPIFTNYSIRKEANLNKLFIPQKVENKYKYSWQPISEVPKYSILVLFLGTLKCTIIALLFAVPLSVFAAMFTSEFAPSIVREIIKPFIELLAGIPSVVLGFFALMVQATFLQSIFGYAYRLNAVNAGIALGFAVIPIVYTICEDAFSSVPRSFKDASMALGASRWQTAYKIVLPSALPGVFAACVLGFGRAIGETMIVLMSSGNAAIFSLNFTDGVRTLSATIAAELGEVIVGGAHYHVLFFIGAGLFVFTFITNLFGNIYISSLKRKLSGEI